MQLCLQRVNVIYRNFCRDRYFVSPQTLIFQISPPRCRQRRRRQTLKLFRNFLWDIIKKMIWLPPREIFEKSFNVSNHLYFTSLSPFFSTFYPFLSRTHVKYPHGDNCNFPLKMYHFGLDFSLFVKAKSIRIEDLRRFQREILLSFDNLSSYGYALS